MYNVWGPGYQNKVRIFLFEMVTLGQLNYYGRLILLI